MGRRLHCASRHPDICEALTAYEYGLVADETKSVKMPEGVRSLPPGIQDCQVQGWGLQRGANGMTRDWKYVDRGQEGLNTFSFPLPSTLASSRPTPIGQDAAWEATRTASPGGSGSVSGRPAGAPRGPSPCGARAGPGHARAVGR